MDRYTEIACLCKEIESKSLHHQQSILRLLHKYADREICFNENKNGIYINMTNIPDKIVKEIQLYLNYVKSQEEELASMESEKQKVKSTFFSKEK